VFMTQILADPDGFAKLQHSCAIRAR
jgi:hypothetical protein